LKSQVELWRELAYELASLCHTSATRDWKTVQRRVENEGFSFLTITLPAFAKDLERSLDEGKVSHEHFQSFKKDRRTGLPRFLGGFLATIFDEHGALRADSVMIAEPIRCVRQLCYLFQKIELECNDARKLDAIRAFIDADSGTAQWEAEHDPSILQDMSRIAPLLWREVFTSMDKKIHDGDLIPKHGPGATADRLRGNAKFDLQYWPSRLDRVFPYLEYGLPNLRWRTGESMVQQPDEDMEQPARVILVPKTLKTPRVIAAEPTSLQYMQQAVAGPLVELLESRTCFVQGMIGFTDQSPNRELARQGSLHGSVATLDMSEASDRVSVSQVMAVTQRFPHFQDALLATRSQKAQLPSEFGGEVIHLSKFAAMGSALCFPMEAICFLTAVFVGYERYLLSQGSKSLLTRKDIKSVMGAVRVYGDDIVIPVDCVSYVTDVFRSLGWKVNTNKSFWTGSFRESCGGDYFAGEWVTPVRVRREFPVSRKSAEEVASLVSLRNQMYFAGYWKTTRSLDRVIEEILPHFPVIHPTSPLLGRHSLLPYRWERTGKFQNPVVRGYWIKPTIPRSPISERGALLKCLLGAYYDPGHLERSGRPSAVDIKLRWMTPY
jgi:hypothetical protein